jgi:dihydropteroate synthase
MEAEGADLVEIGPAGGSRLPEGDFDPLIPIVEAVRGRVTVPIAVETGDSHAARAALRAGAEIIRGDGIADVELRRAAAETGAALILLAPPIGALDPGTPEEDRDVVVEVRRSLLEQAEACLRDGIPADRLLIDPGIGSSAEDDLALLRNLGLLTCLPYPVVVAAERQPAAAGAASGQEEQANPACGDGLDESMDSAEAAVGPAAPSLSAPSPSPSAEVQPPAGRARTEPRTVQTAAAANLVGAGNRRSLTGLEEGLAVITWAVMKGVRVVRVRDVRVAKRACLMTEAVLHPDLLPEGR